MAQPAKTRSAAAKKAAATRKRNQELKEAAEEAERHREMLWELWMVRIGKNGLGVGILVNEMFIRPQPTLLGVTAGLGLLGYNVASWLDKIGGK